MKNYCRDYIKKSVKNCHSIEWQFSAGDHGISSNVKIDLGEKDSMTGEAIENPLWFSEYQKLANAQAERDLYYAYPHTETQKEYKDRIRKEKRKILEDFEQEHGYIPPASTVKFLHGQKFFRNRLLSSNHLAAREDDMNDSYGNQEGNHQYGANDPEIAKVLLKEAIHEVSRDLTPRQQAILDLVLEELEGLWATNQELSERFHVTPQMISFDKKAIFKVLKNLFTEDSSDS